MLDLLLFNEERELKLVHIFVYVFIISYLLIYVSIKNISFKAGLISVFLISLFLAYPVIRFMKKEESSKSLKQRLAETNILKRHGKELSIYLTIFLAVVFAFTLYSSFNGYQHFSSQEEIINSLHPGITGNAFNRTGFQTILMNNLSVFMLSFIVSFLVVGGILLILVWNASILGIFVSVINSNPLQAHLAVFSYLPHGLFEITGYVLAGISAFILSQQFDNFTIKKKYDDRLFKYVLFDVSLLLILGFFAIVLGAFIEVL